ncbi:hypothetical protein V2I01_04710 [Micromonospora sp. BRA006-A]|nr:hypothetical protein [Micromonospora sp. BRA006-A]
MVHDDTSTSRANAGKWSWSCRRPGCPGKGFDYDTEDQARAGAAAHRCKDTDSRPAEGVQILGGNKPAPTANPVPEPTPAGEQPKLATVIPMFPILKEPTMSNAEITGLPTAIAFAQGMASAHRAASTAGGEQYVAALRSFEVGDGTIATVATARELSAQAAAAWERAAAEIGKQNTVRRRRTRRCRTPATSGSSPASNPGCRRAAQTPGLRRRGGSRDTLKETGMSDVEVPEQGIPEWLWTCGRSAPAHRGGRPGAGCRRGPSRRAHGRA